MRKEYNYFTMTRLNESRKIYALICAVIFLLMFLCNALSLKATDDYAYSFSWADGSRIERVSQIISSMAAHAQTMNGRLVAHAFAQLFLMLPDWVFDIVNALFFTIQIVLAAKIARGANKCNSILLMGIFCAVWIFELDFAQVNLWLDGTCNYMWNVLFCLAWIQPYVKNYEDSWAPKAGIAGKMLFLILSVVAGAYGESTSAAFIFAAAVLMALCHFYQHKKVPKLHLLGLVLALAGYVSIYMAPAQWDKGGEFSPVRLVQSLIRCFERLDEMCFLLGAFLVLFIVGIYAEADKKQLVKAFVFFLASLASNFVLFFAGTYPARAALGMTVLMIIADAILLQMLLKHIKPCRALAACVLALLLAITPVRIMAGLEDMYMTYTVMKANEEYLRECADNGVRDVVLPIASAKTKYSVLWGLRYLSTEDATTWPNRQMAEYFGVGSILGEN